VKAVVVPSVSTGGAVVVGAAVVVAVASVLLPGMVNPPVGEVGFAVSTGGSDAVVFEVTGGSGVIVTGGDSVSGGVSTGPLVVVGGGGGGTSVVVMLRVAGMSVTVSEGTGGGVVGSSTGDDVVVTGSSGVGSGGGALVVTIAGTSVVLTGGVGMGSKLVINDSSGSRGLVGFDSSDVTGGGLVVVSTATGVVIFSAGGGEVVVISGGGDVTVSTGGGVVTDSTGGGDEVVAGSVGVATASVALTLWDILADSVSFGTISSTVLDVGVTTPVGARRIPVDVVSGSTFWGSSDSVTSAVVSVLNVGRMTISGIPPVDAVKRLGISVGVTIIILETTTVVTPSSFPDFDGVSDPD
jgi:hypothetical protein